MKFNLFKKNEKTKEEKLKRAKIELVIFLVFIAFVFAYSKILVMRNNHGGISKEDIINKVDLVNVKKYDFNIEIDVDNNVYKYNGNIDNGNGVINGFKIINNEYYDSNLNKINNVFYLLDNKYFNLNTISNYLVEDNYKNNRYEVSVNDIINNKMVDVFIYIDVKYNKDNIDIRLDYSNLANIIDSNINSYKVEYLVSNYK